MAAESEVGAEGDGRMVNAELEEAGVNDEVILIVGARGASKTKEPGVDEDPKDSMGDKLWLVDGMGGECLGLAAILPTSPTILFLAPLSTKLHPMFIMG